MKIRQSDYDRLKELINYTIKSRGIKPRSDYSVSATRYRWDIFYAVMDAAQIDYYQTKDGKRLNDYLFIRGLSNYLNDNHIDTALKNIIN